MKVTVVTPLFRVRNVDTLYANIAQVFNNMDWQWLLVLDEDSPEANDISHFEIGNHDQKRLINRRYKGGDRWASSLARNMALEIEEGWIVNLDDDCLLHDNAALILKIISPDVRMVTWQTVDRDGAVVNFPGIGKTAAADANAFAYQRRVMERGIWEVREDADMYYFHKLRGLFPVAYFRVPGAWWNVNP